MTGFIAYDGVSMLDGETPVIGVVTLGSDNKKTGDVNSLWVLVRDHSPTEVRTKGLDEPICGTCPLRANQGCYLGNMARGSFSVWNGYHRGIYEHQAPKRLTQPIRLGADGDPTAIPLLLLNDLVDRSPGHLGYTHMWRTHQQYAQLCMASVHSLDERDEAKQLGFRTYRVGGENDRPVKGEAWCPASGEMEKLLQCSGCLVCGGQRIGYRGDVFIRVHGVQYVRDRYEKAVRN